MDLTLLSYLYTGYLAYVGLAFAWNAYRTLRYGPDLRAQAGWIPLALGAGSAILGAIGKKKQNNAAKDQARLDNQFRADTDAAKKKLLEGLVAGGWNPMGVNTLHSGGQSQSQTQGRSSTRSYQRDRKITEAENLPMEQKLRAQIEGRLGTAAVGQGEKINAVRAINQANSGALQSLRNLAGNRGLSAQQLQAAGTPIATARAGQIGQYLGTTVPELIREREAANEAAAQGFLLPRMGSESHGTQDTNYSSSTMGSQSGWGEQGPDINAALSLMAPTGPATSMKTGQSSLLSGAQDLLGAVGTWYGNKGAAKKPTSFGSLRSDYGDY